MGIACSAGEQVAQAETLSYAHMQAVAADVMAAAPIDMSDNPAFLYGVGIMGVPYAFVIEGEERSQKQTSFGVSPFFDHCKLGIPDKLLVYACKFFDDCRSWPDCL